MKDLKKVLAIEVEGDWFIIPSEIKEDFYRVLEHSYIDDDAQEVFEEDYGQYRTGGDLNIIQLYAEI